MKVGNAFAGADFKSQGYGEHDKINTNHIGMKFSTAVSFFPDQNILVKQFFIGKRTEHSLTWFRSIIF